MGRVIRKPAEGALPGSLVESVLETVSEPLLVLDSRLRVVWANPAFYQTFHTTPAKTLDKLFFESSGRRWSNPKLKKPVRDALDAGVSTEGIDVYHKPPLGEPRILRVRARPIQAADQEERLALLAIDDVTELRRTERALERELQRIEVITKHANCGLLLLDTEVKVVYANRLAQEWFGPLGSLRGRLCWEIFGHADPERDCAGLKVVHTGETQAGASFATVTEGEERYFYVVATPVKDDDGNLTQITEVVVDITDRKRAEEALLARDRAIRAAYIDVLSAVTGGRLIILAQDEMETSLGQPLSLTYAIDTAKDLATARGKLRGDLARVLSADRLQDAILAASEAMTNALKHGGKGEVQVLRAGRMIQIAVTDSGPGIDFSILPQATLESGFSTKPSLGMGFSIMLEISDKVRLATEPGHTCIVLEMAFAPQAQPLSQLPD